MLSIRFRRSSGVGQIDHAALDPNSRPMSFVELTTPTNVTPKVSQSETGERNRARKLHDDEYLKNHEPLAPLATATNDCIGCLRTSCDVGILPHGQLGMP